jgi:hypothetical protein
MMRPTPLGSYKVEPRVRSCTDVNGPLWFGRTSAMHTTKHTSGAVVFGRMAPTIPVADIERSRTFYEDVLGFRKTFENGDPIGFMILKKDDAELHLNQSMVMLPVPTTLHTFSSKASRRSTSAAGATG